MDVKWLVRWLLVSFVLAAVLTLVYTEVVVPGRQKARQAQAASVETPVNPLVEQLPADEEGQPAASAGQADQVRVHYFHGAKRCNTCRAIEAGSQDAVESGFPEGLLAGRLAWLVHDFDSEEGAQLAAAFELPSSGLVIEDVRDGKRLRHKVLPRVWDLAGDPDGLRAYVQGEVGVFLNGEN